MKKKLLLSSFFLGCVLLCHAQPNSTTQEKVIAQMNYCTNALTNIIHNKSMEVLEHESNQLLNNLDMEQACGLWEIQDYRETLMEAVGRFQITEEERQLVRRIQSIKSDNLKWQALSSALNPAMLITGGGGVGYQAAFQALVAAARTGVEYKMAQGEQKIEALQALWELRKEDMTQVNLARIKAQKTIFSLYGSYKLKEHDRLTEDDALHLLEYISEPSPSKRVRILQDNKSKYEKYAPYYYHLGMALVDNNEYEKAKPVFQQYLALYRKAPIFRHDEMSGCIALTTLAYEKGLSDSQKIWYVNMALKNLPNNSAASLQCALVYIHDLKQIRKGLEIIRAAIDDPNASDRELLYMCIANMYSIVREQPDICGSIDNNIESEPSLFLNTYLQYCVNKEKNAWNKINQIIKFDNEDKALWYTAGIATRFNEEFEIQIPDKYFFHKNDFKVFMENYTGDSIDVKLLIPYYSEGISLQKVNKIECFKSNASLKYLFLNELEPQETYRVKKNLDYDLIIAQKLPRMSEFDLSESDIKDIIKFCKKNTPENNNIIKIKFTENEVAKEIEAIKRKGLFIRFVGSNNMQIVYKYDEDQRKLVNFYYQYNGRRVFASKKIKEEYHSIDSNIENTNDVLAPEIDATPNKVIEDSISGDEHEKKSGVFSTIKGWFSKDTTKQDAPAPEIDATPNKVIEDSISEDEHEKKSGVISTVKGWFSKDSKREDPAPEIDTTPKEEIKNSTTKDKQEKKSGVFSTVKSWFSKTK